MKTKPNSNPKTHLTEQQLDLMARQLNGPLSEFFDDYAVIGVVAGSDGRYMLAMRVREPKRAVQMLESIAKGLEDLTKETSQ